MEQNSFMSKSVAHRTSDWIKQYAERSGVKYLVVGISGGIDSAVVSKLCAMTGIDTYIVSMPIHQNSEHLERAHTHARDLTSYSNVHFVEYDLTKHFDLFSGTLVSSDLALANTRSRLRMVTLYQLACTVGGIVVGTGNKIEDFGVGFFTKYGDGGVDISPIGDLTKTEVRMLARELGIHQSIINAKPSDGLWDSDDKDDETQLGATYEELEKAMEFCAEKPLFTKEEFEALSTREQQVVGIYIQRHKANLHKMNPVPVFYLPKHLKYT